MLKGYNHIAQAAMGTLFTWGVTALGSALVFVFSGAQRKVLDGCLGFAAGVMTAASYWSLLAPAIELASKSGYYGANGEYTFAPIAVGFALGAGFVYAADELLSRLGVHSDPAISLAKTTKTKTVEPNSADTLQDSAVEMDDLQFRDSPRYDTGSIETEDITLGVGHSQSGDLSQAAEKDASGDTSGKGVEPDKNLPVVQSEGKKKSKKKLSKKERRKNNSGLHKSPTEQEILKSTEDDDDVNNDAASAGSSSEDFLDCPEVVSSKHILITHADGTVNPALRMHDTSNGTKSEDPKPSDGLDHAIKLFNWKRILLLIVAITVHNIPEGLAVGVAFGAIGKSATATFENARNLAFGIGIQNFPEGLAVSLPLRGSGMSVWKCFMYGQLSGLVEPVAGILGALAVSFAEPILPYALAFAAGAMIYVVIDDIIPEAQTCGNSTLASWGAIIGFIVMMSLDVGLG